MKKDKETKKTDSNKAGNNANAKAAVKWDLSPAPESKGHIKIKEKYDLFIDGKWQKPSSGKYFDTTNPATEEKLAEIAHAT